MSPSRTTASQRGLVIAWAGVATCRPCKDRSIVWADYTHAKVLLMSAYPPHGKGKHKGRVLQLRQCPRVPLRQLRWGGRPAAYDRLREHPAIRDYSFQRHVFATSMAMPYHQHAMRTRANSWPALDRPPPVRPSSSALRAAAREVPIPSPRKVLR